MSKKYMRIYCNGKKIRSTGSSITDFYNILNRFGCYSCNKIIDSFRNANGFVVLDIKEGWTHVGKMLIPSDVGLNVELTKMIRDLVLYLDNQRQPHKICIYDKSHYFSFSVEIVKKHGSIKEVVSRFNLPLGLRILFIDGIKYFELFTNLSLLDLTYAPWQRLYMSKFKGMDIIYKREED